MQTETTDRDVLTTAQVADLLQFNDETVRCLAKEGRIPAAKLGPAGSRGRWRFSRHDLDAWLRAGCPENYQPAN